MRFIINIVCFLFLLPLIATAQTYKYIGVENGLSNRRIFDIQKDSVGYMWFLTNEGIDRYNGKDIKHYKLIEENKESSFPIHLGWLYFEEKGKLWVIGKAGRIFQYNQEHDVFNRVYKEYINCPRHRSISATAIWTAITGFGSAADTASLSTTHKPERSIKCPMN